MSKKYNKHSITVWSLLILGICAVEFPGILFIKNKVYPFILGMPFLYGYLVCCWVFICGVLFYAWRTRWGKESFFKKRR